MHEPRYHEPRGDYGHRIDKTKEIDLIRENFAESRKKLID